MKTIFSSNNKREIGDKYEDLALEYLLKKKLKLRVRNFLCKMGEIDLIMDDKDFIVFVEVRFRRNLDFGTPFETITHKKQHKLKKTALFYLQQNKLLNHYCRFDAIAIDKNEKITWMKSAFE